MRKIIQLIILITFYNISLVKGQFYIPDAPKKIYPVQDYAGVLSKTQIEKLNEKLIYHYKKTSIEIIIPIVQDLKGESPNFLASKWGEKWKIGNSGKHNGIVILLSINDKKISIQNGYGIEPYITDFTSSKIIQEITPMLKDNLYYQAIDSCIQKIFQTVKNHNFQQKKKRKNISIWRIFFTFLVISILFIFSFLEMKRNKMDISLLNTLFLTNLLFRNKNYHDFDDNDDDSFDGFGGGGNFGGGGSSGNW
ncbi:TPM domain-containing protein [Blattabacterium cuenoti]|uniref:TPM domain-containing protein n=1 Tax=Blattabacterium cuenoti TaxID=1653831 RepID=UPI00163C232E|nr:TPM domain-containing protein [Blattabacterium cuenoti]